MTRAEVVAAGHASPQLYTPLPRSLGDFGRSGRYFFRTNFNTH
jgi:hypothetical protein